MKPINRPVRPPTFPSVSPAEERALPALLVTRESPSDAFDVACDALSFAALAASEVEEAFRWKARRNANRPNGARRSTSRDAAGDIVSLSKERRGDG